MTFLARPVVAVAFGAFMFCTETCLHWEEISRFAWLEMPFHDWTAAGLLLGAGIVRRHDYQAVAWAFMLSLLFGAFFGHVAEWLAPTEPDGWIPAAVVFPILVGLNVIAVCSLIGTLAGGRASRG
jgi:hypothetical protein